MTVESPVRQGVEGRDATLPMPPRTHKRVLLAGLVITALLLAYPYLVSPFWVTTAMFAAIATSGALSLNLLVGYAGQVSVGHSFFIGLGAYTAAIGNTRGWPLPLVVFAAAALPAAVGLLVGPAALRLRELYLAITTLGLVFVGQWIFVTFDSLTGGVRGMASPDLSIFGFSLGNDDPVFGLPMNRDTKYYYLAVAFAALIGAAVFNLSRTRPGRALMAVRDRQVAAAVAGIDVTRYKLAVFALSSAFAGLTGMLYGAALGYLVPETFGLDMSIMYFAMIIAGGFGSVLGSVLGACMISSFPLVLQHLGASVPFLAADNRADNLAILIYGVVIVGFLLYEPEGLAGIWHRIKARLRSRRRSPAPS